MVNCSGSSTGAPDVAVDPGAGGALGLGTAMARGAGTGRVNGVSEGLGEADFRGVGDFSGFGVAFCFFFFLGVPSFSADFFFADFVRAVGFGVFFGVAEGVASSVFLGFGFGDGETAFLLCGGPFGFGLGVGDSSGAADAAPRALRNCARFSSSVS